MGKHVVVWSGGCDSTLLLHRIAKEHGTSDNPVIALSIDHYLVDADKKKLEEASRSEILKKLRDRGLYVESHTLTLTGDLNPDQAGLPQAYLWLTMSMLYIGKEGSLYLGYIRTDDMWHWVEEIREVFRWTSRLLGVNPTLNFPLEYTMKSEIIMELRDLELIDDIWYCETPYDQVPGTKPCGRCKPCHTHTMAIVDLALSGDTWARDRLPERLSYVEPLEIPLPSLFDTKAEESKGKLNA